MLFKEDLLAALECALFISHDPLSKETISQLLHIDLETTEEILLNYKETLITPDRGLELKEIAGGYKLQTKGAYHELVESIGKPQGGQLSRAALETLAIVAYKQPVTRSEVEKIRGVSVDSMFLKLLDKELIYEVGRKEVPGRPILYGTTDDFLINLGLESIEELPTLEAIQEDNQDEIVAMDDEAMVFESVGENG